MAEQKDPVRKKDRDPILTVGFIVLILAFAVVGGVFINNTYLKDSSGSPAHTGDTVKVDYVGSYYDYYTEEGAQVFDTSLWDVADNSAYAKSYEFTLKSKSSYAPLSFSVGLSTSYLPMFQNAVIGLKPGESAKVTIDPTNGYGALTDSQLKSIGKEVTMPINETMTVTKFKTVYGVDAGNGINTHLSPYGWNVTTNSDGTNVYITHMVTNDAVYNMNDEVTVKTTVTGITFKYSYEITPIQDPSENTIDFDSATYKQTELVKIFYEDKTYYVTGVDDLDNPTKLLLKNTDERTGMYLYFTVTRVA